MPRGYRKRRPFSPEALQPWINCAHFSTFINRNEMDEERPFTVQRSLPHFNDVSEAKMVETKLDVDPVEFWTPSTGHSNPSIQQVQLTVEEQMKKRIIDCSKEILQNFRMTCEVTEKLKLGEEAFYESQWAFLEYCKEIGATFPIYGAELIVFSQKLDEQFESFKEKCKEKPIVLNEDFKQRYDKTRSSPGTYQYHDNRVMYYYDNRIYNIQINCYMPFFDVYKVRRYIDTMTTRFSDLMQTWSGGDAYSVQRFASKLALDLVTLSLNRIDKEIFSRAPLFIRNTLREDFKGFAKKVFDDFVKPGNEMLTAEDLNDFCLNLYNQNPQHGIENRKMPIIIPQISLITESRVRSLFEKLVNLEARIATDHFNRIIDQLNEQISIKSSQTDKEILVPDVHFDI